LIRHHHVPHQLVSYFADRPADLDVLARGLAAGEVSAGPRARLGKYLDPGRDEFLPDFAGLMLHGYADRLAGRGLDIGPTAEVLLAVLGFCAGSAKGREDRRGQGELYGRLSEFYRGLNSGVAQWEKVWGAVMGELRPWHQNECGERRRRGEAEPGWEEVRDRAGAILGRRFPHLGGDGKTGG
jgi:hypothetical protein